MIIVGEYKEMLISLENIIKQHKYYHIEHVLIFDNYKF